MSGPLESVRAFRAAVEADESRVRAWSHLDPDDLVRQAELLGTGPGSGPLWGVPVGVKDTVDVAGMPAERGSRAFAGRVPERDAEVVRRLRAAGALIAGKTVTTELAVTYPGPTTNPHDAGRTPGGSSSGSAAAVAAGMVRAALGTQTIASTLRPASFCGVVGFKPTHGRAPLDGILAMSPPVDSIGILGADVATVRAVFEVVADDVRPAAPAPGRPVVGLLRTPWWDRAETPTRDAVEQTVESLGARGAELRTLDLDAELLAAIPAHWDVVRAGIARRMGEVARHQPELLSEELLRIVEAGAAVGAEQERAAYAILAETAATVASRLDGLDVVVGPCAPGVAPRGLAWTGDPVFCQPWSALGFPAISLPLGAGEEGLPVGVQVAALPGRDEELLAFAASCLMVEEVR
ncbi:MAG: amidase [Nocardioidaceae bacterium]|nr:amidase [Nocardioidaceae bacterium]